MSRSRRRSRGPLALAAALLIGLPFPLFAQGKIGPSPNTDPLASSIGPTAPLGALSLSHPADMAGPSLVPPAPGSSAPLLPAPALASSEHTGSPLPASLASVPADQPAEERETREFLVRVGFTSHDDVDPNAHGLTRLQRNVLRRGQTSRNNMAAARELAVKIMTALKVQGYDSAALDKAMDLAADLLDFKAFSAPQHIPEELSSKPALRWLVDASHKRLSRQLDELTARVEDIHPSLAQQRPALRGLLRDILIPIYAKPDSYFCLAGLALTAALARYARQGHETVERVLEAKLKDRGMILSDYIGARITLLDHRGRRETFELKTGDIVGRRPRERGAAEITAAVRPYWAHLWRAWRERLLGPLASIWLDPSGEWPSQVAGQPARNSLRKAAFHARRWLGGFRVFLRGYSHIGKVEVASADNVSIIWVFHSIMDSWEGRIQKSALMHGFLIPSYHVRFGVTRMDPSRAAAAFLEQSATNGYQGPLPALARENPDLFLQELHAGALVQIKRWMALGMGYAYGFMAREGRIQCALMEVLAYQSPSRFDLQFRSHDHWRLIVRILHKLGLANTDGLDPHSPIIWPGSFFADPKHPFHQYVELPTGVYAPEPQPRPLYAEQGASASSSRPDAENGDAATRHALMRALVPELLARQRRRESGVGWRSALGDASGYFGDLERAWQEFQARKPASIPVKPL